MTSSAGTPPNDPPPAPAREKPRVAILGTGRMGSALALAFLSGGHAVTAWNRTAARARPLEAKGVRLAASVEAAVAEAELIIGNINDYSSCAALLEPTPVTRALRGKLFVQLTTGSPQQAREAAAWARAHQIHYLDGAIMATPDFMGQPDGAVLYSGPAELFEANRSALAALGGHAIFLGDDIGRANTLDAAILMVLWGSTFGVWQAAAICEAEGFPLETFSSSLSTAMPVLEGALKESIARIATRRFKGDETTMASVETCHTSVQLIHQISKAHGIHLGLTAALDEIFARARQTGSSSDDVSAVYQRMR